MPGAGRPAASSCVADAQKAVASRAHGMLVASKAQPRVFVSLGRHGRQQDRDRHHPCAPPARPVPPAWPARRRRTQAGRRASCGTVARRRAASCTWPNTSVAEREQRRDAREPQEQQRARTPARPPHVHRQRLDEPPADNAHQRIDRLAAGHRQPPGTDSRRPAPEPAGTGRRSDGASTFRSR